MSQTPEALSADSVNDQAATAGGGYEILKRRLELQGGQLASKAQQLNEARIAEFGRSELKLLGRLAARTENNCVARDIVRVGELLVFGYNVFIGLRKETTAADVFSLYRLVDGAAGVELEPQPLDGSFLADARFTADFRELYAYYKQASLTQLRVHQHKLLAAFRIGQQVTDVRVFRWEIRPDGSLGYIDNRGERDIALPPSYDFEWTQTTREQHINGRHPHINILDTIFVETVNGDLTIKVENNTESGLGIYSEPVDDKNQSLADADVAYAKLGTLILLRIRPYREEGTRYLVFNARTQHVVRIDAIGKSCVQLPEDHGIIFPGGYLLQSGEFKRFDLPVAEVEGLRFKRMLRSPNGEDVLYVFYEPGRGGYGLFTYNLIEKTLGTPLMASGYARFDDGRVLVFQSEGEEPIRTHAMQVWQTPFGSDDHARKTVRQDSFFGRIGNPELVRGVSELVAISRAVREQAPTRVAYDDLVRQCTRVLDAHFWLDEAEAGRLAEDVRTLAETARNTLDEFDKVAALRREASRQLQQAQAVQHQLLTDIAATLWQHPNDFVTALSRLQAQRGSLHALTEARYIDLVQLGAMDTALEAEESRIGEKTVAFLASEKAFLPYRDELAKTSAELGTANTSTAIGKVIARLDDTAKGLDLLTGLLSSLPGGDAVVRSRILDEVSSVYADLNRIRAEARNRHKSLGTEESRNEFAAQMRLFGQAVENALDLADAPEKCDESLTRLLAQMEELEGRFGEQDAFVADLAGKRENVYEAFAAKKQNLLDARTRRGQTLTDAAQRILAGVARRVAQLDRLEQVHAYFAADPLLAKLRSLIADLRALDAQVAADDLDTQLKAARDQAIRAIRDKQELVGEDGNTIRFGRQAFTISRQQPDLTLVPHEGELFFHITGTDYRAPLVNEALTSLRGFWEQALVSETADLYRGEYLAGLFLAAVHEGREALSAEALLALVASNDEAALLEQLRRFAAPRYQEGYVKGVHDHDAARLLRALVSMESAAGLLVFGPEARALAQAWWSLTQEAAAQDVWRRHAQSMARLRQLFGAAPLADPGQGELVAALAAFAGDARFPMDRQPEAQQVLLAAEAADYLLAELAGAHKGFVVSGAADDLVLAFTRHLERAGQWLEWRQQVNALPGADAWRMARQWLRRYAETQEPGQLAFVEEGAAQLAFELARERRNAILETRIEGLLGDSPRLQQGALVLNLNDFHARFRAHRTLVVPGFERLQQLRQEIVAQEKQRLRLTQFQAKPLSSFVRNRLIDEVYLPLVGDNLAKQIGAAGNANRSDRMGLLLLISPPGYGKTTLMEYICDRLGMIFVRINCPALGHDVTSLDPTQAPHSAARSELEKLNLGLAMGNNVMLYLDDIQHTHPEFLQKFIALSDGTRRIEGVWDGTPRTYDMRGKRFAIVMAGNPYTESGDVFKIPDMLANRADIYNLGDVLSGREDLFALSYLENSLTANPVLLPLSSRDPADVHRLIRMAQGEEVPSSEFAHTYSAAELNELTALLRHMFVARDLLLKVNLAYIASAAQDDDYRTEPPFKLQGSYRNMNKLAAKISSAMQPAELGALLRDHYRGEAQTLTTGAEENLLKLAHLIGTPTPEEGARWQAIVEQFRSNRLSGGPDADGATRVTNVLADIAGSLKHSRDSEASRAQGMRESVDRLCSTLQENKPRVSVTMPAQEALTTAVQQMAELYEKVLVPLVTAQHHKLSLDHSIWDNVREMAKSVQKLDRTLDKLDADLGPKASAKPPARKPIQKKPGEKVDE
ncbi:MAG: repair protein [Moraxellaceae bacterium]|jgi:hypothetical protein|nr:repair protein [Moraxellaceae bacterium]